MPLTGTRTAIGLFGGTFDPVHFAHLRMALELKQSLGLDQMRLLPCGVPPHREAPHAGAGDRADMLRLALADCPDLQWDATDLNKAGPAYAVETLEHFRAELGEDAALCLAMGMDSLATLDGWHRWRELGELAHLVVAARPGWQAPEAGPVADWLRGRLADAGALRARSRGAVVVQTLSLLPISATQIRALIGRGESPQFLIPDAVWRYIRERRLYGAASSPPNRASSPT